MSSFCGSTWAFVTIVDPSPTANPVPRNRNGGVRVCWNVPTPTTDAFTRSIVAGICVDRPHGARVARRRRRERRRKHERRGASRYIRADGAPAMSGEGSATLASYGWSSLGK